MRFRGTLVLAIFAGLLALNCAEWQRQREEMSWIRQAEDSRRPFTPVGPRDTLRRHVAFRFRIVGDSLQFISSDVQFRPGRMPYRPGNVGDFRVAFLDKSGDTLETYTMEDPRLVRSCDIPPGGRGEAALRTSGLVEILAPADTSIAFIVVVNAGGRVQRFPPAKQLITLPPPVWIMAPP